MSIDETIETTFLRLKWLKWVTEDKQNAENPEYLGLFN